MRRHPIDAVGREAVDVVLPGLAVEQIGLAIEELLDVALDVERNEGAGGAGLGSGERRRCGHGQHGQFPAVMYSAQALK